MGAEGREAAGCCGTWGSSSPHLCPRTDGAHRARWGEAPGEERSVPCRSGPDTRLLPAALPEPPGLGVGGGCGGPGRADGRQGLVVPPPALEPAALSTWSMQASGPTSCLVLGEGVCLSTLHENPKISACPLPQALVPRAPLLPVASLKAPAPDSTHILRSWG